MSIRPHFRRRLRTPSGPSWPAACGRSSPWRWSWAPCRGGRAPGAAAWRGRRRRRSGCVASLRFRSAFAPLSLEGLVAAARGGGQKLRWCLPLLDPLHPPLAVLPAGGGGGAHLTAVPREPQLRHASPQRQAPGGRRAAPHSPASLDFTVVLPAPVIGSPRSRKGAESQLPPSVPSFSHAGNAHLEDLVTRLNYNGFYSGLGGNASGEAADA